MKLCYERDEFVFKSSLVCWGGKMQEKMDRCLVCQAEKLRFLV